MKTLYIWKRGMRKIKLVSKVTDFQYFNYLLLNEKDFPITEDYNNLQLAINEANTLMHKAGGGFTQTYSYRIKKFTLKPSVKGNHTAVSHNPIAPSGQVQTR